MHLHKLVIGALGFATLVVSADPAHAQAQNYEPIVGHSGVSGTYLPSSGRGGFGGVFEIKFNVHDHIAVGFRGEGAVMFGGNFGAEGDTKISIGAVGTALAKGEYYLTTGLARPFVGLGIGMYDIVSQSIEAGNANTSIDQKAGRYFGVGPSIGFDLGRLRLAATYNIMLGADIIVRQQIGMPSESTVEYSQNYFTFEMTFRFGGRRKQPPPPVYMGPPPGGPIGPPPGYPPGPMGPPPNGPMGPPPAGDPMPAPAPPPPAP